MVNLRDFPLIVHCYNPKNQPLDPPITIEGSVNEPVCIAGGKFWGHEFEGKNRINS